jgi:hypothetical protein
MPSHWPVTERHANGDRGCRYQWTRQHRYGVQFPELPWCCAVARGGRNGLPVQPARWLISPRWYRSACQAQNLMCAAQAAAVLAALAVTALWEGGWLADPLIALGIAAWSVWEGRRSWLGADCC